MILKYHNNDRDSPFRKKSANFTANNFFMAEIYRCGWCEGDALYESYHDNEWGVPVYDDDIFFEFLVLETFQAGLSWITILRKREHFRNAFDGFDYKRIANYNQDKIDALLEDAGIVRNKLKINGTVTNAKAFMGIQNEHGSFSKYIWGFTNGKPIKNALKNYKDTPASSALSDTISKALKKQGFKFVGTTVVYAFLQATGLINDHEIRCFRYEEV